MRVGIYLRVSTTDQDTRNQVADLERWANARGYQVVATYRDEGISGSKGRDQRPGLDALLRAATRREIDMVAAWSMCRLGRSLKDLVVIMDELRAVGVGLFLHQQAIDSSTPAGAALLGMSAVFAEFERSMGRERVKAALAHARAQGKILGRPALAASVRAAARQALLDGRSVRAAAKISGASNGVVGDLRQQLVAAGELAAA